MITPGFDDSLLTRNPLIDGQHEWLFTLAARLAEKIGTCDLGDQLSIDDASEETSASDVEPLTAAEPNETPDADAGCDDKIEDAVGDGVFGLIDYITEHFEDEEKLMRDARYPGLMTHVALHEELSRKVSAFAVTYMNGDRVAATALVEFFDAWLREHIMERDREFVRWLARR